jgi:hypothetical protein
MFLYRYIVEKGKLVLLDDDNIEKYIGKTVKLRSPLYCNDEGHICNICAGELYRMMGMKNVGLISYTIGSSLLNASMKMFHDMTIHTKKLNIEDYIF